MSGKKRVKEYWSHRWKYNKDEKWSYSSGIDLRDRAEKLAADTIKRGGIAQIIRVTCTYHIDEISVTGVGGDGKQWSGLPQEGEWK